MPDDGEYAEFILTLEDSASGIRASWRLGRRGAGGGRSLTSIKIFSTAEAARAWGILEARAYGIRNVKFVDRTARPDTIVHHA